MVKFTKQRMFINHKIGERRSVMTNYESLIEKEKNMAKFYTRGFINILAQRIGMSAILCLVAGFIVGYLI